MNEWNCLVSNKTLWLVRRVFVDFSNEILHRCYMSWFRFNVTAKNRKPEFKMADKQEKMIIRTLRDRRCVRLLRFPLKWQQIKPEVNLILETRSTEITSVQRKKGIPRLGLRGTELTRKVFDAVSIYVPFPCTNDFLQSKSLFSQTNVSSGSAVTREQLIGSKKRLVRIIISNKTLAPLESTGRKRIRLKIGFGYDIFMSLRSIWENLWLP